MPIDLKLSGKVAIITGGSKGLGAESARLLAADGARVALVSRTKATLDAFAAELTQAHKAEVMTIAADLSQPGSAEPVAETVLKRFGRIDILINSAGAAQGGVFWEIPEKVWEDGFALKFFGTVRMTRAVLPAMIAQGYGRIVHVVGDTGKQPNPRLLPGATANAALLALTKGLADEVGPRGIAVNAVNPGPTRTDRIATLFANLSKSTNKSLDEIEAGFMKDAALGTIGDPADVARVIVFLASDAAANITGTSILSDGGRSRAIS